MMENVKPHIERLRQFARDQEDCAAKAANSFDKRRYLHGAGVLYDASNDLVGEEPWPGKSGATNVTGYITLMTCIRSGCENRNTPSTYERVGYCSQQCKLIDEYRHDAQRLWDRLYGLRYVLKEHDVYNEMPELNHTYSENA